MGVPIVVWSVFGALVVATCIWAWGRHAWFPIGCVVLFLGAVLAARAIWYPAGGG